MNPDDFVNVSAIVESPNLVGEQLSSAHRSLEEAASNRLVSAAHQEHLPSASPPQTRIALLSTFFGKMPSWIDNYIETCKYNPSIEWYLFFDEGSPDNQADNVHVIRLTLLDFSKLVRGILGRECPITTGRKSCDFRPAFGSLFQEYLRGFDFWGYCDLDVIWGQIRTFLTGDLLARNDVISGDPHRLSGPFSIFRNAPQINQLYGRADEAIFADEHYYFFEEQGFDRIVKKAANAGEVTVHLADFHEYEGQIVDQRDTGAGCLWHDGRLFSSRNRRELMYYHFIVSKQWRWNTTWSQSIDQERRS